MTREPTDRDLIDSIVAAWQREMPDLDTPEYELARRATRLGILLEEELTTRLAPWGLTKAEYGILNTLRSMGAPYELRPSDLKARLMLTSGGVSSTLKRLENAGLIERTQDATDGRSFWVRLTETGIETAGATTREWAQAESVFFSKVPEGVLKAASDALRQVLIAIGDLEPPTAQTRKRRARASQRTLTSP